MEQQEITIGVTGGLRIAIPEGTAVVQSFSTGRIAAFTEDGRELPIAGIEGFKPATVSVWAEGNTVILDAEGNGIVVDYRAGTIFVFGLVIAEANDAGA